MLVDSHCHLDLIDLAAEEGGMEGLLARTVAGGVDHMLCVCLSMEERTTVLDLAQRHPFISASVGVHPNHTEGAEPTVEELVAHAADPRDRTRLLPQPG